ncbi:MAG: PHP domain-containing protein [Candidatus Bathyarchaeia archaeon]
MKQPFDKVDLHIHTTFSDGRCSVDEVVTAARLKGLRVVAITDHYSEYKPLPKRMTRAQLPTYLTTLEGRGVLRGVEAEVLEDGGVSMSEEVSRLCDVVIGGLHILGDRVFWYDPQPIWNPRAFVEEMRTVLIKAMETGLLDIVAHVTWLPEAIRPQTHRLLTKEWVGSIIDAASDNGIAIEISGAWRVPDEEFVRECVRHGVKLSVGSDAHNAKMVGDVRYPLEVLGRVGAPDDSLFLPNVKG